MDCRQAREELGRHLDDDLSAERRHDVEVHLSSCTACADELASLRELADALAVGPEVTVPDNLWPSIEQRLSDPPTRVPERLPFAARLRIFGRPTGIAAAVLFVVGLGLFGLGWFPGDFTTAQAAVVDFGVLLDALPADAPTAFRKFLMRYEAREIPAHQARAMAPDLDFEVPDRLPGGFRRGTAYVLRFGPDPGIAAAYHADDGRFLVTIFHKPVPRENFGTHRDYPCVVGQHRGHAVEVGRWRLVHLTDPSTCHCVLSQLDTETELVAVMAAVASRSSPETAHGAGPEPGRSEPRP